MTDSDETAQADCTPGSTLGLQVNKKLNGSVKFEPYLFLHKIPKCPLCGSANPRDLDRCPECGAPAPDKTDYRNVPAELTDACYPWHARLLLWIAGKLMSFANWIEGNK